MSLGRKLGWTLMIVMVSAWPAQLLAQHKLFRFNEAPGGIAHKRLIAEPGIANYDQPVNVILDPAGQVAFQTGADYQTVAGELLLGMQVGPVYRLRVSMDIAGEIVEVYPSIEMVDRLYPPTELATRFPINIVLDRSDVENAAAGRLVTKVVYLENPDTALPFQQTVARQAVAEVGAGVDPLETADRLGRPLAIVRVGSRMPSDAVADAAFYTPVVIARGQQISGASLVVADEFGDCGLCECQNEATACPHQRRRDEWVCDGDDRKLPAVVSRSQNKILGLDLEDTVATFSKPDGKLLVAPSNRVCIYSPRFASVRRILGANSDTITQKLNVANQQVPVTVASGQKLSVAARQNVRPQLNRAAHRANQFVDRTRGVLADNVVKLSKARSRYRPFEDLSLIRYGKFENSEGSRISLGLQSAIAWESRLSAQMTVKGQQPVIVNDSSQVQEIVAIETDTSADLRLVKIASKISAQSGDTVDFTIRFDNIGRNLIREVTIADNLSPRLEFIPNSAECSLDAELTTSENEGGSLLLQWKLAEPLKIREGGVIRFSCRVR